MKTISLRPVWIGLCAACFFVPALVSAYTGSEGMTLLWKADLPAQSDLIADVTANANGGTVAGNVTAIEDGFSGAALSGFTSNASRVSWEMDADWPQRFTLQLWLRNPGSNAENVVAVGGSVGGSNRPWQINVSGADADGRRTVSLVFQSWVGGSQIFTSAPVVWESGQWYQLALAWAPAQVRYKDKEGKERVETGAGFRVYLTAAGSEEPHFLFGGTTERARAGGAATRSFTVGGSGRGYYKGQTGGFFGGDIDEVSLWLNRTLNETQLKDGLIR